MNKRISYSKYNNKRINIFLNKKNKQSQALLLLDKNRNNVVIFVDSNPKWIKWFCTVKKLEYEK